MRKAAGSPDGDCGVRDECAVSGGNFEACGEEFSCRGSADADADGCDVGAGTCGELFTEDCIGSAGSGAGKVACLLTGWVFAIVGVMPSGELGLAGKEL